MTPGPAGVKTDLDIRAPTPQTTEWATPQAFNLHAEVSFTLDVAAQTSNTKCLRYFTPEDDGLTQP